MNQTRFSLKPLPSDGVLPGIIISGSITRQLNALAISYVLTGNLSELEVPLPADLPARKINLWEETCFEFFLALKNSDQYWEFNLSPAGHWNVYRFKAYRQDMREEASFTSLPFTVQRQADVLLLSVEIDLNMIIAADQALRIGISAVTRSIDGSMNYWALIHPGAQADFHRKESFIVGL
jgi:hypothetical protein